MSHGPSARVWKSSNGGAPALREVREAFATVAALAAFVLTASGFVASAAAQDELPPLTPENINMDTIMVIPLNTERFGPETRSPTALLTGMQALHAIGKAYSSAPALRDAISYEITGPDGVPQGESFTIEFEGDRARIAGPSVQAVAADGVLSITVPTVADRYVAQAYSGNAAAALANSFAIMPSPDCLLRAGGEDLPAAFSLLALHPVSLAAHSPGALLFVGPQGDVAVEFDPASHLLKSASLVFTPEGAPEVIRVKVSFAFQPAVLPALSKPIAFDASKRARVSTMEELLGVKAPLAVGDTAPSVTLADLDGKQVALSSLRGKFVVLEFWATWCGPCRKGLPLLGAFARWAREERTDIAVFGINVWEEVQGAERVDAVKRFWSRGAYGFPTLLGDDSTAEAFSVSGIPATVVIGPDGKVVAVHVGFDADSVATLKRETAPTP